MAKAVRKRSKGIALIKKSNQLIEARYKFDVWEMRFFLTVLSNIRKDDTEFEVYRIWYKDVIELFGLKSNSSYELLRQAAKDLMQKSFFVNYETEGVTREVQYHILRKIDYLKEGEEAKNLDSQEFVDVTVEPEMKPFLLELQKNFTAYEMRHVRKLGVYPIRIYELMKQYETIGHRTMKLAEIKRILELTTEYPRFSNFYQKIIVPAITAINRHTDILITDVIQLKEGRSVEALKFTIRPKSEAAEAKNGQSPEPEAASKNGKPYPPPPQKPTILGDSAGQAGPADEQDRLFGLFESEVVRGFGVSPTVFMAEIGRCDEEQIARAVRVTRKSLQEGTVKNPSGFFMEALRKGYTNPQEEKTRRASKIESLKGEMEQMRREILVWQERGNEHINQTIRELTAAEPGIAALAVDEIQENPMAKAYLTNKEKILSRPLTMEDFRQDPTMREWVKLKIIELRREAFEPKLSEIEQVLRKLQAQLDELKTA
mgnify:CR=1 FL=1